MASTPSPILPFKIASKKPSPKTGLRVRLSSSTSSSHYQTLGVKTGATCQEIKAAYRKLARVLHPDVNYKDPNYMSFNYDFIKLHEAYETLSDPDKRADYDRSLFWRDRSPFVMSASTPATAASGFSGYTRRRWETDQCW